MVRETESDSEGEQSTTSESNFDFRPDIKTNSDEEGDNFDPLAGRDGCKCQSDYRGSASEIYCPRCRQEVRFEWSSDELVTEYPKTNTRMRQRLTISHVNDGNASDDSGSTFDSWPSADEEEIVKPNGEKGTSRLRQVIKADLNNLTGTGPVAETDYDGDIDEPK